MIDLSVLKKIYVEEKQQAVDAILTLYTQQKYAIINYLYFAQLMHQRLLEGTPEAIQSKYYHALLQGDFLFADGIALQLFHRWLVDRIHTPPNLNGTDFCPVLLRAIIQEYGADNIHLSIFNVRDEYIGKSESYVERIKEYMHETYGCQVNFTRQCHYRERQIATPRKTYEAALVGNKKPIRVLLNFIGAPYQEVMVAEQQSFVQTHQILVLNQGGTIDFWMGVEKRAPVRVVKARVFETPRRILSNPQKNLRKFMWMFGVIRVGRKLLVQSFFSPGSLWK